MSSEAEAQLAGAGYPLVSANTILVLGSDQRPKGSKEPGANSGPSRSDSIMLMRVGGGHSAKLSILRDTVVPIPGHGMDKINAAYAYGGAALSIKTIKDWLGIPINHVVEINFQNFPDLIDSMGGIDYSGGCVVSKINGGSRNGGYTLRLRKGTHHINGKQALALARTRHNLCNAARGRPHPRRSPAEDLRGDEVAAHQPGRVHPAAVGRVERAEDAAQRHERPDARGAVRRPGDRRLAADAGARADGREPRERRRRPRVSDAEKRARGPAVPSVLAATGPRSSWVLLPLEGRQRSASSIGRRASIAWLRRARPLVFGFRQPSLGVLAFLSASFFCDAILSSCLSAPSWADFSSSRALRFVP